MLFNNANLMSMYESVFNKYPNFYKYIYNSMTLIQSLKNIHFLRQSVYYNASQTSQKMALRLFYLFLSQKIASFCNLLSMLTWSNLNTFTSTPAFFNTVNYPLGMADVAMRLQDLTKFIKRFRSFRKSLVFSLYCSDYSTDFLIWVS